MTASSTSDKSLKIRGAVKSRKPKFRRHESWRYKRLKKSWRRPRGLDNKVRRQVKGWPKSVNVGYGGPRSARGLHPSGYQEVLVHTPDQVTRLNPEVQAIRIGHQVGMRKRIQISSLAKERKIHVLNPLVRKEVEEEERSEEEAHEEAILEAETTEKEPSKKTRRKKRGKQVAGGRAK